MVYRGVDVYTHRHQRRGAVLTSGAMYRRRDRQFGMEYFESVDNHHEWGKNMFQCVWGSLSKIQRAPTLPVDLDLL